MAFQKLLWLNMLMGFLMKQQTRNLNWMSPDVKDFSKKNQLQPKLINRVSMKRVRQNNIQKGKKMPIGLLGKRSATGEN